MHTQLVRKLSSAAAIDTPDEFALNVLLGNVRDIERKSVILWTGETPTEHCLLLDGWAARCKMLADGTRQIIAILLPGDFCSDKTLSPVPLDYSVIAITAVVVAKFSTDDLQRSLLRSRAVCKAFWRHNLVEDAIQRSWVVSLGRRDAQTRLAHLICELHVRLGWIGLVESESFPFPLTQPMLADVLGLTAIHLNRSMQALRHENLITHKTGILKVLDLERLRAFAGFDAKYLINPLRAELPF
jgi:CRP-like cAMP-binding protein